MNEGRHGPLTCVYGPYRLDSRPVWEWYKYPTCWVVVVVFLMTLVAGAYVNPWWFTASAGMAIATALVYSFYRNDTR